MQDASGIVPTVMDRALAETQVRRVTSDSRLVREGDLFVAVPGTRNDGRTFIAEAVGRGAIAVLAPEGTTWPPGVPPRPLWQDPEPRRRLAEIAARLAGRQPAHVVAVTGTNGKTSVAEFLRQIWTFSGLPAASIGTLGLIAPGMPGGSGLTTPDPVALAEDLAGLAVAGIEHVGLEASSHGLDQHRLDGLALAAAAFTNLTRDHLDYHPSLDAYRDAKLRLFGELLPAGAPAIACTTLDDDTMAAMRRIAARRGLLLHSVGAGGSLIDLLSATPQPDGQEIAFSMAGRRTSMRLKLVGRFQVDNALTAAALALCTGTSHALDALPHLVGVRGRMELAARLDNGAAAYVDFAHTPDALERLLGSLRPHTSGRLVVVFGAGGDRDRGKRPIMGEIAARLADFAIVTDDNPRGEVPASIRAAILAACPGAREIGDRRAAIAAGLDVLRPGDVLVVAGKGHEQGQTIAGETLPFDDCATIRALVGAA